MDNSKLSHAEGGGGDGQQQVISHTTHTVNTRAVHSRTRSAHGQYIIASYLARLARLAHCQHTAGSHGQSHYHKLSRTTHTRLAHGRVTRLAHDRITWSAHDRITWSTRSTPLSEHCQHGRITPGRV